MNYTETLKIASLHTVVKQFTKMPMSADLGTMINMTAAYDPFMHAIKGRFQPMGAAAFKTASVDKNLLLADKYLNKATLPNALLSAPKLIGGVAGVLAMGALGHHFWKTLEPDVRGADVDKLYKELVSEEPEISNYPTQKAKHYMGILLEHSKILSTKPKIFAAMLTRVLPFPTFPYEQLANLDKITGADTAGQVANLSKGMSYATKMLGA